MRDIVNNTHLLQVIHPQMISAAALNTGHIDLLGADSLMVAVLVGNISETLSGTAKIDLKIEHADDNGAGAPATYTNCTDDDVLNASGLVNGIYMSIDANAKENKRHVIGYRGAKRFVRVTLTPTGLTTGGAVAAMAVRGDLSQAPAVNI